MFTQGQGIDLNFWINVTCQWLIKYQYFLIFSRIAFRSKHIWVHYKEFAARKWSICKAMDNIVYMLGEMQGDIILLYVNILNVYFQDWLYQQNGLFVATRELKPKPWQSDSESVQTKCFLQIIVSVMKNILYLLSQH